MIMIMPAIALVASPQATTLSDFNQHFTSVSTSIFNFNATRNDKVENTMFSRPLGSGLSEDVEFIYASIAMENENEPIVSSNKKHVMHAKVRPVSVGVPLDEDEEDFSFLTNIDEI